MKTGFRVEVHSGDDPGAENVEHEWLTSSLNAPVQQRRTWPSIEAGERWHVLTVWGASGVRFGSIGIRDYPSNSLPGFRVLRVLKFGLGLPEDAIEPVMWGARQFAMSRSRVLRLHLEAFAETDTLAARINQAAVSLGFVRRDVPREYERTLFVDLQGTDTECFGRFHRMVLKNVRKSERAGHVVRPITEARYADRMAELMHETMARTGAKAETRDWTGVIRATNAAPRNYRLSGLFLDDTGAPESLAAFRWCGCAGLLADDLAAASTRLKGESGGIPMMPAVMLDVFRWARAVGARHFDFGGIVASEEHRYAQLGSITEFKRLFGSDVRTVGADYTFVARPVLSRTAEAIWETARRFTER